MQIYKTVAYIISDDPAYVLIDTIEYKNKFWLVPNWIESPREGWKRPEQIICLEPLPHKRVLPEDGIPADFVLLYKLPIAALDDQSLIPGAFDGVVINSPDIQIPIPKGIH